MKQTDLVSTVHGNIALTVGATVVVVSRAEREETAVQYRTAVVVPRSQHEVIRVSSLLPVSARAATLGRSALG